MEWKMEDGIIAVFTWDSHSRSFEGPCFFGPQIMPATLLSDHKMHDVQSLVMCDVSKFFQGSWYPGVEVCPVANSFDSRIEMMTKTLPECRQLEEVKLSTWMPEKWKTQLRKVTSDDWQIAWRNIVRYMEHNLNRMLNEFSTDMDVDYDIAGKQIRIPGKSSLLISDWIAHKDYVIRQMGYELGKTSDQLKVCLAYRHMQTAHARLLRIFHRMLGKTLERDAIVAMIMMHWFLSEFPYYVI